MGNTNGKLNPNTIIEKITEVATAITDYQNLGTRTNWNKVSTAIDELVSVVQSTERAKTAERFYTLAKTQLGIAEFDCNGKRVVEIKQFHESLKAFKELSINGNAGDKSKEVLASSEVENLTPISNNSKQLSKKKGKL